MVIMELLSLLSCSGEHTFGRYNTTYYNRLTNVSAVLIKMFILNITLSAMSLRPQLTSDTISHYTSSLLYCACPLSHGLLHKRRNRTFTKSQELCVVFFKLRLVSVTLPLSMVVKPV